METERFEGKMALLAKKNGLRLEWQPSGLDTGGPASPVTAMRR